MRALKCLRCGEAMTHMMREKFQMGDMGTWVGNINLSMRGGLEMDVYSCPNCGKIEFFLPESGDEPILYDVPEDALPPEADSNIVGVSMDGIPQVKGPACGAKHDFDYPKCPRCDYRY